MNNKLFKNGDKFKVVLTLDVELITDLEGVTKDQIIDIFFNDDAYGLKSVVAGKIDGTNVVDDNCDTEIVWDNSPTIEIV